MPDVDDLIRRSWPLFLEAIRQSRTITYTELAGQVGPPLNRRQVHRQFLAPLAERCRRAGLPDLSALIVRKSTGTPGNGWHGPEAHGDPSANWAEALRGCLAFAWPARPPASLLDRSSEAAEPRPRGRRTRGDIKLA